MVYTIEFNEDEPPSYDQATAPDINKTKEIEKESTTDRLCGFFGPCQFGVTIGIGMFKRSYIS